MYLSDDNLADDKENFTEPKRKRKQKLLTVSLSSNRNNSSITKVNQINRLGKKRLLDKFYQGDCENENVQVPENNNSSDKKRPGKFLIFFLMKIPLINGYVKNYETECFIQMQRISGVLQKQMFCKRLF